MRPKPYIEATLRTLIPKFTKLCSLDKPPYLTFSRAEVKRLGLRRFSNLNRRYMGMAWKKENVIFVSPRKTNTDEARKTLAHEFIHLRFSYSHGKRFEELIGDLLKGVQFSPKRKAAHSGEARLTSE